jgi:hypothetical protein
MQHWLTILGDPHHMVFQIVNRVRRFAITHCPSRVNLLQHTPDHNVRAASLPLAHRTATLARSAVKTACLKAGVLDPIYRQ